MNDSTDIVVRLVSLANTAWMAETTHLPDLDEAAAEITRLRSELEALLEDRARFPDKPDFVGNMIHAHIENLKLRADADRKHAVEAMERGHRQAEEIISLRSELEAQRECAVGALREALPLVEEYSCKTQVGHIATDCETVASRMKAALSKLEQANG